MNRREEALKAYIGIRRTNNLVEAYDMNAFNTAGINLNEFGVLELLYHLGPQPVRTIKEKILMASSSTTYIIDGLEKKGLVVRTPLPDDRRVLIVSLTEQGNTLIEAIFPDHATKIKSMFDQLSDEELVLFRNMLKKISAQVNIMSKKEL